MLLLAEGKEMSHWLEPWLWLEPKTSLLELEIERRQSQGGVAYLFKYAFKEEDTSRGNELNLMEIINYIFLG